MITTTKPTELCTQLHDTPYICSATVIQVDDLLSLAKTAETKLAAYKTCKDAGQLN